MRTCRRAQQQDQKENRYNTAERSDLPSHLLTGQSAPVTLYRLRRDGEFASANGKGEQAECARWPQQQDKTKGMNRTSRDTVMGRSRRYWPNATAARPMPKQ